MEEQIKQTIASTEELSLLVGTLEKTQKTKNASLSLIYARAWLLKCLYELGEENDAVVV